MSQKSKDSEKSKNYVTWKKILCELCDCCGGGHKSGGGGHEGDARANTLISEFITDSILEGENNFDTIKYYADMLAKDGLDKPAYFVYSLLPKVAVLSGDVASLRLATAMIDYARFLDQQGKINEADTIYNISLLSLHNKHM